MIYAVQCGAGGPIKFGLAKNPRKRMYEFQTGNHNSLRLVASLDMGQDAAAERLIHEHLAEHNIKGEWFRPTVPVLEMVRLLREGGEKPLQAIALRIADGFHRTKAQ